MKVFAVDESSRARPWLHTVGSTEAQKFRILSVVRQTGNSGAWVSDKTLACYFDHLVDNLQLPFTAWYPEPKRFENPSDFECSIVELLDPRDLMGDPFDGIFCRSRKDRYEVNLPLVELALRDDGINFQLLDDYRHWFWNWRARLDRLLFFSDGAR